jgi:metal-dependent amidase/aminoacylase/carboxypeptidase family protein
MTKEEPLVSAMDMAEMKELACHRIDLAQDRIRDWHARFRTFDEPGFGENDTAAFVSSVLDSFGLPVESHLALTGCRARLNPWDKKPRVALVGSLDDMGGGTHATRLSGLLAVVFALSDPKLLNSLTGGVDFVAAPAGSCADVAFREALAQEGKIRCRWGIGELIRLGIFDSVDLAIGFLPRDLGTDLAVSDVRANGLLGKRVRFCDPDEGSRDGTVSLNAMALAVMHVNALRGGFVPADHVQIRATIGWQGVVDELRPGSVRLEFGIHAASEAALSEASRRVDAALRAAAGSVGASVKIFDRAGFLPLQGCPALSDLFGENAIATGFPGNVVEKTFFEGSSGFGDLSCIIPTILPFVGGVPESRDGTLDFGRAVLLPAKAIAMTVIDLLSAKASKAEEIVRSFHPLHTRDGYVDYLDSFGS